MKDQIVSNLESRVLTQPNRILVILLRQIGDVILTTPAIRVLKRHFPQAQIDFVANPAPAEILVNNPNLHDVIVYPYGQNDVFGALKFCWNLYRKQYDISIDYLGTTATAVMSLASRAKIRIGFNLRFRKVAYTHFDQGYRDGIYNALTKFTLLKPLNILEEEAETEILVTDEAQLWAEDLFKKNSWKEKDVFALATGANRSVRRWLPERFAEVAYWLHGKGGQVLLTWGAGEEEYVRGVQQMMGECAELTPKTDLMQLAAILQRCRLFIGNCTGTKHVAVAVGTPTLTIHGPSDPAVWTPSFDSKHRYVSAVNLDCLGCGEPDCDHLTCMKNISAEQVIHAVEEMSGIFK